MIEPAQEQLRASARRVVALCALAFCLMLTYALARPAAESLFLSDYSRDDLPKVWLFVSTTTVVVVFFYVRLAQRSPVLTNLSVCIFSSAGILALCLLVHRFGVPGASFGLYIWKDIYIVVLVEVFWSFANVVTPMKTARWVYGFFLASGSAGSVAGGVMVGPLATSIGTVNVLWLLIPLFVVLWLGIRLTLRGFDAVEIPEEVRKEVPSFVEGAKLVAASRYLLSLFFLIGITQIVITLVDYEFNGIIEAQFPKTDERTAAIGDVYKWTNAVSFIVQISSGLILKFVGVSTALFATPAIVFGSLVGLFVAPGYPTASLAKLVGKVLDYSLFRAAKEILYIPLEYAEKTQGKAVIDMMMYRLAKGGASILLLGLIQWDATGWVLPLAFALVVLWGVLTAIIVVEFKKRTNSKSS